jgi:hypothetical protein
MTELKKRVLELAKKILSFKFLIFVITCVLRMCGTVGATEWLTVTCLVLTGHVGMKALHTVQGNTECGG